jgi:hypothetical protein
MAHSFQGARIKYLENQDLKLVQRASSIFTRMPV